MRKFDFLCIAALNKLHTLFVKRKKGVSIGAHTRLFYKSSVIVKSECYENGGGVVIGNGCVIGRTPMGYHAGMPYPTTILLDGKGSRLTIGDNCRINGAYIHSEKSIVIGSNCVIASGVNIIDSNGHQVDSLNRTVGRDVPKEIVIGDNVWICMNTTILKGSVIGDNSVIAAGCVVSGIIPPNTIASTQGNLTVKNINFEKNERD